MKKNLLLFGSMFLFIGAQAQTIISEDFEGTGVPATWSQTTLATDGGWKQGLTAAISSTSFPIPDHTKFVGTNDDGCNCDKSNDFIVSPSFSLVTFTAAALKFDVFFVAGSYQSATESFSIEASTDGGSTWNVIQTLAGAGDWRTEIISLNSLAGNADVKIGFRYNDGAGWTYGAAMDNFSVYSPMAIDASISSINTPTFIANNQPFTISGSLTNFGGDVITTMDLNYTVDAGATVTQSLSGLNIAAISGQYTYSHSTPYTPTTVGAKTIKVWASNINGQADMIPANDEMTSTVNVASQVLTRVTVVEELTSSTCAPCASLNVTFDPLLASNNTNEHVGFSNVTAIKYQMNWPSPGNDPSYNPDGVSRRTYYGTTGIPELHIDGGDMNNSQASIDNAKAKDTPMNIVTSAIIGGNMITVNVDVTPYVNIPSGTKLHIAVLEKQYDYAASTTSQDVFHHIMRKMLPNGNGTDLTNLQDGVTVTKTGTYTFTLAAPGIPAQNSYALWTNMQNLEVVAFVQNNATKEIYQSSLATITAGINDVNKDFNINLFPNPVQNDLIVTINAKSNSNATIDLYNTLGQVVVSEKLSSVAAGDNTYHVNTTNLNAGIYFAKISFGAQVQTIKFVVEK